MLILLSIFMSLAAQGEPRPEPIGHRPGYLSTVKAERHWREVDLVLLHPPLASSQGGASSRPLVAPKLTREFQTRYEQEFGRTDVERNFRTNERVAFYDYPGGKSESVQKHKERQQRFGEYMFRRLVEDHIDQYAKSNPEIRPLYELKDRIANVNVQVKEGYKLRINYSYSGNYLDLKLDNPYQVQTKFTMQMNSGGLVSSNVQNSILSLAYDISPRTAVSLHQELGAGAMTFIASRRLTKTLSTSLTTSLHTLVDQDDPLQSPRHDLVLLGLSWTE